MSWSASLTIPKGTPFREAEEMVTALKPNGQEDLPEAQEAIKTAKQCVLNVLASGTVSCSRAEEPLKHGVGVTMSGHANPGFEPQPVYSNDGFMVSIWQMTDPTE